MKIQDIEKLAAIYMGCALGSVILHFAAPFILAILMSALSFVVPFAAYHIFFKKGWRIRLVRESKETGESDAGGADTAKKDTCNTVPANAADKPNGQEPLETTEDELAIWYEMRGKPQFLSIRERMSGRGIYECWVRKDGICNIKTPKGYRRIHIFYGYPADRLSEIADYLRRDGIWAEERGKYLYINWYKDQEAAG